MQSHLRCIQSRGRQIPPISACATERAVQCSASRSGTCLPLARNQLQGSPLQSSCPIAKGHQCRAARSARHVVQAAQTKAFIWDCDGVIIESEEYHRLAYNASFQNFNVREGGKGEVTDWSVKYYDKLMNTVGGGKAKMRYHFDANEWPTSSLLPGLAESDEDKTVLIDELQDWKTKRYQELVATTAEPRPNVLRLFDEARELGLKVGVCSAATKSSAIAVVENLLGKERFQGLDVFMAGDDVPNKKPDPSIYTIAAERLGLDPSECIVIEDSTIGVQAATGAGMRCIVTYTNSTADQHFHGAERIMSHIKDDVHMKDLLESKARIDDRPDFQDV